MKEVSALPRKFRYNGTLLDDIDSSASPEELLAAYTDLYPDLTNAAVEGPVIEDDAMVYTFRVQVGTKGADRESRTIDTGLMESLAHALDEDAEGEALLPPPEALGVV